MRPSLVVSLLALVVALGGTSYAAVKLTKDSVRSKHIKNGQVKKADLARNAVDSSRIVNGTVAAEDLAAGTVTSGAKGEKGETGPAGPTGPAGAKGDTTIAGEVKVTNSAADAVPVTPAGEGRFTIARMTHSAFDVSESCADLTILPAGTVLIEKIQIQSLANVVADLEVSLRRAGESPIYFEVPLHPVERPNAGKWADLVEPEVVVKDGEDAASDGELFRSAARPARLCTRDTVAGQSYQSFWTITGRVLR